MKIQIKNPKDFWLGAVYLLSGAYALRLGTEYPFGTTARMGPGYFPAVISSLLIVFGVVSVIRSLVRRGEGVRIAAIKPLLLITAAAIDRDRWSCRSGPLRAGSARTAPSAAEVTRSSSPPACATPSPS